MYVEIPASASETGNPELIDLRDGDSLVLKRRITGHGKMIPAGGLRVDWVLKYEDGVVRLKTIPVREWKPEPSKKED